MSEPWEYTAEAESKDAKAKSDENLAAIRAKILEKVLEIKQQQREIIDRLRERHREQAKIQKIKRALMRHLNRKTMGFAYREQMRALLAQYLKVSGWQEVDIPKVRFEDFIKEKSILWGDLTILLDVYRAFPEASRSLGDGQPAFRPAVFNLEDWQSIKDLTDSLVYMDRWEREHNSTEILQQIKNLSEGIYVARKTEVPVVEEGVPNIRPRRPGFWDWLNDSTADHLASLRKVEFLCIALDGGERMGPVWQAIFGPVAKAYDSELAQIDEYTNNVKNLMDPFLSRHGWADEKYEYMGRPFAKEEIIVMALNCGDAYNLGKLLDGNNLRLNKDESDDDADRRIHAFLESVLTKKEFNLVYNIWNLFESLWPQVEAIHHELTGQKLKRTKGYYFPIIHDWKMSRYKIDDSRLPTMEHIDNLGPSGFSDLIMRNPRHSQRMERMGGKYPLRLSFGGIADALYTTIHDANFSVTRRNVGRIIASDAFKQAVTDTMGGDIYEQFPFWLSEIAKPSPTVKSSLDRIFGWARRAGTTTMLCFKASTMMSQPTAYTQTIDEIGTGYALEGLQRYYSSPLQMARMVNEMSIEMKKRSQNFDRDLAEIFDLMGMGRSKRLIKKVSRAGFSPIAFMDYCAAYPTWLGAYAKGCAENSLDDGSPDHDKACQYADMVVRLTQHSGATIELSKAQRGTETQKAFYMFATFFNGYYNRLVDTADRAGLGKISKLDVFKSVMLTTVLTSWMNILLTDWRLPDKWEWLGAPIAYASSGIWMVRDVTSAIFNKGFDYRMSPTAKVFQDLIKTGRDAPEIIEGIFIGDLPAGTAKDIIFTTGYLTGLPSYQAWITYQGANDLLTGESSNPLDMLIKKPEARQ